MNLSTQQPTVSRGEPQFENGSIATLDKEEDESQTTELVGLAAYGILGMSIIICSIFLFIAIHKRKLYTSFYISGIAVGNIFTGFGYLYASAYRLFVYLNCAGDITPLQCMIRNWQLTLFIFGDTLSLLSFLMVSVQHYMATAAIGWNKRVDNIVQFMMLPFIVFMITASWFSAALRQEVTISAYCYGPSVISGTMTKVTWGSHAALGLLNCLVYLKTLVKLHSRSKASRTAISINVTHRDVSVIKRLSFYMTALFLTSFVPDVLICVSLKDVPFKFLFLLPGVARTISVLLLFFANPKMKAQSRETSENNQKTLRTLSAQVNYHRNGSSPSRARSNNSRTRRAFLNVVSAK